jgi:WD40 repeat protein
LEYSLDGDYLASGSEDGLIRIWHTESFHNNTSKPHMERPTRTPKNADTILGRGSVLMALSFSRNDSNLLASGEHNGEIKVWNIKEQACIHSFNPGRGWIPALFFAGGVEVACIAVAEDGSIIRLWRGEGSTDFASEIIGNAGLPRTSPKPVFSPSGSFLATRIRSTGNASTVELFELATFETRSVVMPHFTPTRIAVTDTKQLVVGDRNGRIRILQTEDFSIQPDLDPSGEVRAMPPPVASPVVSVAFDPACRVLAIGCCDGRFELRTL